MEKIKNVLIVLLVLLLIAVTGGPVKAAGTIPGKIEAESYDSMSGIQTESCSEGTQNVGWIDAGDWMNYNLTIQTTGTYTVGFRVASPYTNTRLQLKDGGTVLATVTVPNTGGFQTWSTVNTNVNLTAGTRTLQVYAVTNGWNFNWMNFTLSGSATPTPTRAATATPTPTPGGSQVIAPISSATASSAITAASLSCDGNTGTRWESSSSDPQWIYWDLGSNKSLARIIIDWEVASAANYTIQGSTNATSWTNLATVTNSSTANHNIITTNINGSYRYVRMYGTSRTTGYGYSIWETTIYVLGSATPTPTRTATATPTPTRAVTPAPDGNLALNKTVTVSSTENGGTPGSAAVDGNTGTRWSSAASDPQWIYVDLGASYSIGRVVLRWETAYGRSYTIQTSTNATNWTNVYSTSSSDGGVDDISFNTTTARYVRMYGTVRATGWGYSLWEFEVYGAGSAVTIPVQGPYIQYIQIGYSPADLSGVTTLISQNTNINQSVRYNTGANVTISVVYLTDSKVIEFWTINQSGQQVRGNPLTFTVHSGSVVNVDVTNPTPGPTSPVTGTPTPGPTATPTPTPIPGAFNVLAPINGQMITSTRTPTLSWQTKSGATRYEVWINTTRSDYDWRASGNLLDRYTKVGETTGTTYTAPSLVDRWTYKWYVVAVDGSGGKSQSNIGQFSVYLPYLEQAADGVNIVNGCRDMNKNGSIEPFEDWHLPIQTRLNDLMSRLTNEEKFRQCFYGAENDSPMNGFSFSYGVEGGMTTTQQNCAKTRMGIPTAFAGDKIHGWKTIYPTELGLAATRDLNTVFQCGNLQRVEHKSFGFTGTLMPVAEVNTKVLYPRFQEGCGENADDAAAMLRAFLCGLQGGPEPNPHSIMTTVKHWPSQGAGGEGALQYDAVTIKYHMKPWYAAVDANAISVMPGYSSAPYLDPTGAGSNESKPIIDYLRNVIGFKGFIVTDWLGANSTQTIKSMGAGIDVMGGAPASSSDLNTVLAGIGQTRLDDAARRILEMKLRLGLFENPYGDPSCTWNALDNHNIALNAAKKSITLLKNNGVLPINLSSGSNMVVGGPRATWPNKDNDPNVIWQSIYYSDPYTVNYVQAFQNKLASKGINVYQDSASNTRLAVVVIGEKGYTHGTEWVNKDPNIPADQLAVIQNFKNQGIPVVTVVISPRPYVLTEVANLSDALMLVYRGGSAIAEAVASLCNGDFTPTGKLPFQLPRSSAQIGTDEIANQLEKWAIPYDLGASESQRTTIRNYINNNQTVPTNFGDPLYPYGAGLQSF